MNSAITRLSFLILSLLAFIPLNRASSSQQKENSHAEHRSLQDNVKHRGIIIVDDIHQTTPAISHQMTLALEAYENLSEALVEEDLGGANQAAHFMAVAVKRVATGDLRELGRDVWEQHASLYVKTLLEMQHVNTLKEKRSYFAHISEIVYCTVKSFNLGEKLSNVYFCPMALEGKGAYWLTENKEIKNPYFGAAMLRCGEHVEVLGP